MSEKTPHRRPATFKLDDPGVIVMDPDDAGRPARGTVQITPEPDPAQLPVPIDAPLVPARRGFRWGTLFWTATGGLVLLGLGLGVVNLIEDLFARSQTIGLRRAGVCRRRGAGADGRDRRAKPSGWRGSPPSRSCTSARPKCCAATIAPPAGPSSTIC